MDRREQLPAGPGRGGPDEVIGAVEAAQRLQRELAGLGIACDVHAGHCLALVSVWSGLVVWTDGRVFRWKSGRDALGRAARNRLGWDAYGRVENPAGTAQRVAARYAELRRMAAAPVVPKGWAPQ
ncbi:hypothetical protein AB0395_43860 [Streptosporangium sp. NPDC051023]|uniref:hypothetical protein n=1 Tax=Streptosporangium sp. NPDC051023 TaxID=3155410 RepID=UPI003450D2DB